MPSTYNVQITPQAQQQMEEIVDYISHELCSPDAAAHLLDKFEKNIMSLSDFPERFSVINEKPWDTQGIRKIVVNNFLIYYWIDKTQLEVHVIAVIYNKRDQFAQLKKIFETEF
jgi:toxin ParE1/3/4